MRRITILKLLFQSSFILAQNVGIGTNNPSTNLHLKGNIQQIFEINDGFEDANLDPPFLSGNADWFVQSTTVHSGSSAFQAPSLLVGQVAKFTYPINVPEGKVSTIRFYLYSSIDFDYKFDLAVPANKTFDISEKTDGWVEISYSFDSLVLADSIHFVLGALEQNLNEPEIFIDNLVVSYTSGHALRIEDGMQTEGALLVSDGHGNVRFGTDWDQFLQDSSETNELQSISFSAGIASLSNGNSDTIKALRNQDRTLMLSPTGGLLWGSSAMNTGNGATAWGVNALSSGLNSTAFGNGATASGDKATAFGLSTEASGTQSTSWGYSTLASGLNSTS